jgi:hypothetical protein
MFYIPNIRCLSVVDGDYFKKVVKALIAQEEEHGRSKRIEETGKAEK